MKRRGLILGCKFLYSTDDPDVAIVELRSLAGLLTGYAVRSFVVNRNIRESVTEAHNGLLSKVMIRDLKNGRARRASDELSWWLGTREIGYGRPQPGEAYKPYYL